MARKAGRAKLARWPAGPTNIFPTISSDPTHDFRLSAVLDLSTLLVAQQFR